MLRNHSVSTPFSYQTGANTLEPPTKRFRLEESSHSQGFNQDDLDEDTVPYGRRSRSRHHRALRSMDPPSNTLIIRNLSNKSDPKMVKHQFEVHGPVDQFDELISRRGVVFVTYYDSGAAQTAFRKMRGSVIDGSIINVQFEPLSLASGKSQPSLPAQGHPGVLRASSQQAPQTERAIEQLPKTEDIAFKLIGNEGGLLAGNLDYSSFSVRANRPAAEDRLQEARKLQQMFSALQSRRMTHDTSLPSSIPISLGSNTEHKLAKERGIKPCLDIAQGSSLPVSVDVVDLLQRVKPWLPTPLSENQQIPSSFSAAEKSSSKDEGSGSGPSAITLEMLEGLHQVLYTACAARPASSCLESTVECNGDTASASSEKYRSGSSSYEGNPSQQFSVISALTKDVPLLQWSHDEYSPMFSGPFLSELEVVPINWDTLSDLQNVLQVSSNQSEAI
ncbi:Protein MEI2-like 2 [Lentinula edodes]|uniref:Protein MEI2-like 2 n=1 Tax=Lentinula edodes TaxID=5353 RepID=A0A1Q3EJ44_LENED|nr:Protein MEI2-like 2 [Lentinula edodes]